MTHSTVRKRQNFKFERPPGGPTAGPPAAPQSVPREPADGPLKRPQNRRTGPLRHWGLVILQSSEVSFSTTSFFKCPNVCGGKFGSNGARSHSQDGQPQRLRSPRNPAGLRGLLLHNIVGLKSPNVVGGQLWGNGIRSCSQDGQPQRLRSPHVTSHWGLVIPQGC